MKSHLAREVAAVAAGLLLAVAIYSPAGAKTSALPQPAGCPSPAVPGLGTRTPVLLVHGFNEGPFVWNEGTPSMLDAIGAIPNVKAVAFNYYAERTSWVTDPLIGACLATWITDLATASMNAGGPGKVIIVAHSMGGLAVRCAVEPQCVNAGHATGPPWPAADAGQIGLVITLGTPNVGSWLDSRFRPGLLSTVCHDFGPCAQLASKLAASSKAAEAMQERSVNPEEPSAELANLQPWSSIGVPLDALAGRITLTTSLFGRGPFCIFCAGELGDLVVSVASAQAGATQAESATIDCGYIPISELPQWSGASKILGAPAPPVKCWHLTETTDSAWQSDITADIRPAAEALSLRACTPAAISAALAAKDPTNGTQRTLVADACQSGWAVAETHQPLTLSNGSTAQDTGLAVLRQTAAAWASEGLGDGICLNPGACPGYPLPPPTLLHLLLQKAGISTAPTQAELYISTQFTPGALYKYPSGPTAIGIDNHDYIASLQWKAASQGNLIGMGTLHYDDCTPDCASGTYETYPVQITASSPRQCNVQIYPQGLGNPSQTVNADVFNLIDVRALQGAPPSYLVGDSVLPGPCTRPAG